MALAFVLARASDDEGSPEERDRSSALTARPARSPHLEVVSESTNPKRVLVAEDDAAVRATTKEVLETYGYDVIEAADGEEALKLLKEHPVEVLLLDMVMPRRDGIWLLDHIDPPPPVVIVFSAFEYISEAEVQDRAGAKVFQCVRKPVSPDRLLDTVVEAIEKLEGLSK